MAMTVPPVRRTVAPAPAGIPPRRDFVFSGAFMTQRTFNLASSPGASRPAAIGARGRGTGIAHGDDNSGSQHRALHG